jgi:hypothetical protein
MRSARLAVALASLTGLIVAAPTPASYADPTGTVALTRITVPATVAVRGASEAGLAYVTDSANGGYERWWLKAPGADPVPSQFSAQGHFAMAGRMLFDYTGPGVRYAIWDGPVHSCPDAGAAKAFLPTGWAYVDTSDDSVKVVDAPSAGCTARTFLAATAEDRPLRVFAGDASGLVVLVAHSGAPRATLSYYPNADPSHPIALDTPLEPTEIYGGTKIRGGVMLVYGAGSSGGERTWRVPVDGTPATELPATPDPYWESTTASANAQLVSDGLAVVSTPPSAVNVLRGVTGAVVSDGTFFYTTGTPADPPGIYARKAVPGNAELVVAAPTTKYPTKQYGVALTPGRVYYTNWNGQQIDFYHHLYDAETRAVSVRPGSVSVGAEQQIGSASEFASLSASAGRMVFDGNLQRTYSGALVRAKAPEASPPTLSGNRWLVAWGYESSATTYRTMYDVRTGRVASTSTWPQGAQDLFGNYLFYERGDGTVRLRNLLTGAESVSARPNVRLGAVAIHSHWEAWVTGCDPQHPDCAQVLTIRDLSTGAVRRFNTRGTLTLEMSGGYLALDAIWSTTRTLRVIRLSTGQVSVIGTLPHSAFEGSVKPESSPQRQFDVEDDLLGWIDVNHAAKLVRLAPFADPPRYLGNVIAPASFSTRWSMALPVSAALPSCLVTIYKGTTKVRILNCANTNGMVAVTWDGKTGSGATLPAGQYQYRVSGKDKDGYWLRNYDGSTRAVSGPITKTA